MCVLSLPLPWWICSEATCPFLPRIVIHYLFIHLLFFYSFHEHAMNVYCATCWGNMMIKTKNPLLPMSSYLMKEVRYVNKRNGDESMDMVIDIDTVSDGWIDDWQLRITATYRYIWEIRRVSNSPAGERWSREAESGWTGPLGQPGKGRQAFQAAP